MPVEGASPTLPLREACGSGGHGSKEQESLRTDGGGLRAVVEAGGTKATAGGKQAPGTQEMAEGRAQTEHCVVNSVGRVPSLPQSQPHPVPAFRLPGPSDSLSSLFYSCPA